MPIVHHDIHDPRFKPIENFICSLSLSPLMDPVSGNDGHLYEREEFSKLPKDKDGLITSPNTKAKISSQPSVVPFTLINIIKEAFHAAGLHTYSEFIALVNAGDVDNLVKRDYLDEYLLQLIPILVKRDSKEIVLHSVSIFDYAVIKDKLNIVKQLFNDKASLEGTDLIFSAIFSKSIDMLKLVLSRGISPVDVFYKKSKKTPLHYAAECNQEEMVALLLEHGADYMALNDENETACSIAAKNGKANLVATIMSYHENTLATFQSQLRELQKENQEIKQKLQLQSKEIQEKTLESLTFKDPFEPFFANTFPDSPPFTDNKDEELAHQAYQQAIFGSQSVFFPPPLSGGDETLNPRKRYKGLEGEKGKGKEESEDYSYQ